jgi:hypothetical protein
MDLRRGNKCRNGKAASQKAAENYLKIFWCPSGAQLQNFKASSVKVIKKEIMRIRH